MECILGRGLLGHVKSFAPLFSNVVVVTDDQVAPLYGVGVKNLLGQAGYNAHLLFFPHGESNKTRETKKRLEDQMFQLGFGRDTSLIALGGGVVTDLGGYLAATYCRGISYLAAPTSLLGMADAAIGGKTGVNVPWGKNLVGSVYFPKKIVVDLATLDTLPISERKNGVAEMVKHGVIADRSYFSFLEENMSQLLSLEPRTLEKAILESQAIKQAIVHADQEKRGKRHLLNFGHTIGHAIEKVSGYTLPHGLAVAVGMMVESYLSTQLGLLSTQEFTVIQHFFTVNGYTLFKKLPISPLLQALALDKKSVKGRPQFVLLRCIGSAATWGEAYTTPIDSSLVKNALHWMNDALCKS